MIDEAHLNEFFRSIVEREELFIRKELLKLPQKEWTDVPVYQKYRFCNVHRCYDKTYRLLQDFSDLIGGLHVGLRTVLRWTASNPLILFLMRKYKEDLEWRDAIDLANDDSPQLLFRAILAAYHRGDVPLVSGSFIVKRYGNDLEQMIWLYETAMSFDDLFLTEYTTIGKRHTTKEATEYFRSHRYYVNWFSAYCIISDWIYLMPEAFTDIYTWTAYGPGAYRGICLISGEEIKKNYYLSNLQKLRMEWEKRAPEMFDQILKDTGLTRDELQDLCIKNGFYQLEDLLFKPLMLDVEHWLCEYAKYSRGWAKRKYKKEN